MRQDAIFGEFPMIESEELVLKKVEDRHLEELFALYSNDKVFEHCGIIPKHNKETVRSMIGHFERDFMKRSRVKWGIFAHNEEDKLLGIIEAFDFQQKLSMVTIGYILAEAHWGQGLATRAVRQLLPFLFENGNVNRIQAEVMPVHEASKRVLLKNGFLYEGTLRQAALWSGQGIVDLEIYGLLRSDYDSLVDQACER